MIEPEFVKRIISLLESTSIEEFELEWEGKRLLIRRPSTQKETFIETKEEVRNLPIEVISNTVGIFYPSVGEGSRVKEGEKIGEVETLGIREEILAPAEGVIENLLREGEIVEYGKTICIIKQEEVKDIEEQ
jgi:acetyl-CoA carboxylase biotin carboxyl carrier protein